MLKKSNKLVLIILFFISCDETEPPTISNEAPWSTDVTMYLYGYNTEPHNVRLSWLGTWGDGNWNISFPEFDYETTTYQTMGSADYGAINGTLIEDIDYNPGFYFMAYVDSPELNRSDSALVKIKEIDPVKNIVVHVEAGGYDDSLAFTHSSDSNIIEWDFYNFQFDQNNPSSHPHYFDISNSLSGWKEDLTPLGWWGENQSNMDAPDYYIYSKENVDDSFCYMIQCTDDKNYSRNSYIKCSDNYARSVDANWGLDDEIISITNNLRKKIIITWEEYTDPDFYQYIIWRSEYQNMPEDSKEQLNVVIESNQTEYHDSKGKFTIDGKTWYYQIEVQNQYGNSEFSEIVSGTTRP